MNQEWMKDLLETAKSRGFSDFEIYMESSKRFSTSVFKGELDKFSASEPSGISVRGIYNGKMGNAYTEKMDRESLNLLVEDCLTNAQISETEDISELFAPADSYPVLKPADSDLNAVTAADKIEMVKRAEAAAMKMDSRVDQVQNQYGDFSTKIAIVNSKGLNLECEMAMGYIYFAPIVKVGQETKNELAIHLFRNKDEIQAERIAEKSVAKTVKMLGAEILASGSYKTVMGGQPMASLIQVMASIFSAEAADKGLTYFKDKVGQQVASPLVNLVDNPHLEAGFATIPFDSEGVPTKEKRLIDKGELTGFLHNLKTARKFGVAPSGNGFKASFKTPVGISATNFFMEPGEETLSHLLGRVGEGLYITGLDGLHAGINAITGEFSLSCKGFKIEAGQLSAPVHQITVSGNYFDLLKAVEGVADDFAFEELDSIAVYGAPSVYVGNLVVAGK